MKTITQQAINALSNGIDFKRGNTKVVCTEYTKELYLHGHKIAWFDRKKGTLTISNCNWFTNTTKERLNGLDGVHIIQKKFDWYLNGVLWLGQPIEIK